MLSVTYKVIKMISANTSSKHHASLPWWKQAAAYQIYPRSFFDTNDDGIGDIQGIIEKLDYLCELGIDLIWICPFYQSPNDDNGYDISDYQAIHPDFGTLTDVDELISQAHQRGIRVIIDLVINHTSDEHPWFIESRQDKQSPKRDWYIWRDGSAPSSEKPTQDPNNWESIFHGSAWEFEPKTEQYYLHLFSKKQPDLNWENPEVKQALFDMIHWWVNRGIDGFRVDAISHIQKKPGLPSLENPQGLDYVSSFDYHMNVEGIENHLQELKEKAFSPFDIVTVGEANGVSADDALLWVEEKNEDSEGGIFNMIFQFEHMALWAEQNNHQHFDIIEFKKIMTRWQNALEGKGWNALYLENHDQARSISTFGHESYWYASATSLATCYFLMKGTPFIYQGQEIGMTNNQFKNLADFQDVSAKNLIQKLSQQGKTDSEILTLLNKVSRDHSRTPMQWNRDSLGGFSKEKSWIEVNSNTQQINVENQQNDENSVLSFYKNLIQLRKNHLSLITGRYKLLLPDHPYLYVYQRISDSDIWTIITNLSDKTIEAHTINLELQDKGNLVLTNQNLKENQDISSIAPYAAFVFHVKQSASS